MIQGAFGLIRMTPACQSKGERPLCLPAARPDGGYKPWQGGAGAHNPSVGNRASRNPNSEPTPAYCRAHGVERMNPPLLPAVAHTVEGR